jgi:large subunit ribosomal protein L18
MKKIVKKLFLQKKKRSLKKVIGSSKKPRLSVFRSHKHIYAQLIDDKIGHTLTWSSTLDPIITKTLDRTSTEAAAFIVGQTIAKKALVKNIKIIIFDRGEKPYHGRIKQMAQGAREEGLVF